MKACSGAVHAAWLVVLGSLGAGVAHADEPPVGGVPKDLEAGRVLPAPSDKEMPKGWKGKLTLSGTGSYGHSSHVVGAVDGGTTQLGVLLDGGATYRVDGHEWETLLRVKEQQSRTPVIQSFIKSGDELVLQSTYLFHPRAISWVGPYARAGASTQVFDGYLVYPEAKRVVRTFRDGTVVARDLPAEEKISLTKGFEPLVVRESAGAFFAPVSKPVFTLKAKAGPGLQHILVRDGFVLRDTAATPELELAQLEGSTEGGTELELEASGKVDGPLSWSVRATFFYPFYSSRDTNLSASEKLNSDIAAKASLRLAKWASLDYVLSAKRLPLVVDAWQVQNNLLLSIGVDLI